MNFMPALRETVVEGEITQNYRECLKNQSAFEAKWEEIYTSNINMSGDTRRICCRTHFRQQKPLQSRRDNDCWNFLLHTRGLEQLLYGLPSRLILRPVLLLNLQWEYL